MSGHTPGPWIPRPAKEADAEGEFSHYIFAEQYGVVGYWRGHKRHHTDHNWLLTEADARLIAAAPDLLEALRDLHDAAESPLDDQGADSLRWACYIRQARAAIAKATQP